MNSFSRVVAVTAVATAVLGFPGPAPAQQKEVMIGAQCDRTGPTQIVGVVICPAIQDYIDLINSKGGVEGYKIKYYELDNEYKVPQAVEEYERQKQAGAVSIAVYGTPQVQALNQKLQEDKIPGTSPGFGISASADGSRFPYLFPVAATYWSQGAAAIQFIKDKSGGSLKGKKIAYVYYANPAGHEPLPILEDLQKMEGFELRSFAVPPPGVEMGAQVLDITQRYHPDFVIDHLFGRSPSVSIKELKRVGYPLRKVVSFVWGSAEADVEAAGGWPAAEGYHVMQFAGVGQDFPVIAEIREMYRKQGKDAPKEMASTVYYNRGVLIGALHVEAIRNALKARPDGKITGKDVKRGFERIKGFTLGGLVPPLEVTATDHEGGGLVQVWQVRGGKWMRVTDWFKAYPEVVAKAVKEAK